MFIFSKRDDRVLELYVPMDSDFFFFLSPRHYFVLWQLSLHSLVRLVSILFLVWGGIDRRREEKNMLMQIIFESFVLHVRHFFAERAFVR